MEIVISAATESVLKHYAACQGQDVALFAGALLEKMAHDLSDEEAADSLEQLIARKIQRTPEQLAAARARAQAIRPAQALPPNKSLEDVFFGQWPSNESDAEIARALKAFS